MLFSVARLEKATRLFGLVGLTTMKLSDSLPDLTLTLVTGAVQVNGTDGLKRLESSSARSWGFMHLRVPSGTSMAPLVRASICGDVAGAINARRAASIVRLRRVFIWSVLIDVARRVDLKRTRKGRDSSTISERVSSLILSEDVFRQRDVMQRQNCY